MAKFLVLLLFTTAAVAIATRVARSPGGLGWQSSYGGLPNSGIQRSSDSNWGGPGLIRSARNGGWDSNTVGFNARSRSNSFGYRKSSNNGWSQNGYSSNAGYNDIFSRSYPEYTGRSSDSTVIDSVDSSPWDDSGFYSKYWQSMGW
ncbi:hypothetical protein HF086_003184 [Spodoptera exigua]|uniref:Uncharacterized protein n=1 Tax=Spodoptera exigua TaxID=7107 RepID=A0A922SFB9_SPOEX|nr:hypothetical protein HF086_003184 [Spodoptera exigua]